MGMSPLLPECYGTIDCDQESRARLKNSGDGEARIDEGNLFQLQTVLWKEEYRKTSDSSRVPYTSRAPDTGRGFK